MGNVEMRQTPLNRPLILYYDNNKLCMTKQHFGLNRDNIAGRNIFISSSLSVNEANRFSAK